MDDGDDASYDPMKDPLLKPRRTTDPGWNYGYMVTPGNSNIVKCNICGKVTQGGIKRHKEHLAGTGGDAIGCPGVSTEVRREMIAYLEKNRRNQPIDLDEVVEVDAAGTSRVQYSTTRPSSGTAAKRNKRAFATKIKEHVAAKSVVSMLRKKPEVVVDERRSGCSQSTMESSTKTVEERHYVSMQWALFFYECGIPFNVASSRQFQIAIEASCQYGPGYKPPSPHELREPLLKDCVKETKLLRAKHEAAWKQYGCTLMSDGWSDRRGRHLINFLVNSPEGTFFLESVDASSECQDARMIADLLEKRIEDVGKENVVQVVTDNGANYKAAGKILMERIPTLYWSPCACHCLDLMLEDVGKLKEFKRPIARGKRVTNFIYRHGRILSLMRKATGGLDLVRPVGLVRPTGVKPCSQSYVNKVKGKLESMGCRIKTSCPVKSVSSFDGAGYRVLENDGSEETYDSVILGVHAPNALKVLGAEATHYELKILGACQYVNRDIYLHCDQNMMPQSPSAWSAWNFLGATSRGFSVTYWLNHIQEIESVRPFLVTLNPPCVPDHILLKWCTSLPVPSVAAAKAYLQFDQIQGKRGIWFCGAYDGHGFHEDGLKSGKAAAQGLLGKKCELLQNPKQMIPSWTEAGVRLIVARFLNQYISIGNLIMVEGGSVFSFGKVCDKCRVKSVMRVHDPLFYWKVATEGMFGLAEAYINGCFTLLDKREGLLNLILILIANRDARRSRSGARKGGRWRPYHLIAGLSYAKYFLRDFSRRNTATQTRRNISQHYDLSNDFFSLNMDKSMTYSCAIFKTESESLEAAQQRKLSLLIAKAKVEAGHHVLETGSGWGSLAIQVVKETGCKYTGVTLSEEQLKYSEKKVREAGLEEHITFLLCDYRQIPPCKYDAIISIEMIEHVGHEYMDGFFAVCESHLAEDGILALQFISIPEEQYDQFRKRPNFVKEYIFPGGCLPSLARVTSAMSTSSRFCIEHVENIGYNYYPTLMRWMDKFTANKDQVLAMGFDEKFIRIWEYYLIYSAAGCKSGAVRDYQVVFSRPGNPRLALRLDA